MPDRIDWFSGTPRDAVAAYLPWREAAERVDAGGGTAELIALLRSGAELGPDARDLLADLLARYRLSKHKGGQRLPAYRVTLTQGRLRQAAKLVGYFQRKGRSRTEAIVDALRELKRDALHLKEDIFPYSDDEIDAMISDDEFDKLENFVKRGRK